MAVGGQAEISISAWIVPEIGASLGAGAARISLLTYSGAFGLRTVFSSTTMPPVAEATRL